MWTDSNLTTRSRPTTRPESERALPLGGDHRVIAASLAQEQVLAEEQVGRGHSALNLTDADIVERGSTALDIRSCLPLAG